MSEGRGYVVEGNNFWDGEIESPFDNSDRYYVDPSLDVHGETVAYVKPEKVGQYGIDTKGKEGYWDRPENSSFNKESYIRFADSYFDGNIDESLKYLETKNIKAPNGKGVHYGPGATELRKEVGDIKRRHKAKEKTLDTLESIYGRLPGLADKEIYMGGDYTTPRTLTEARAYKEGMKRRYKYIQSRMLSPEILNLDKGGFKKLEDFALDSGRKIVKEGMDNLRDRMAGETDRDTGKGARKALTDMLRNRQSGIGSSAAAKSSMEQRAATAAAINANSQAVNKYLDRIKAREQLAKSASEITSYDIKRKRDLRSTKGEVLTSLAGLEADELGMKEIKDLSNKKLDY